MRNSILVLLVMLSGLAGAATRTWSSAGSTDMNAGANYSGSGALLITDDLVFDGTSTVNATATATVEVNSVTIAAAYSGAWSMSNYTLRINQAYGKGINHTSTTTTNWGSGLILTGTNDTVYMANTVGAITSGNCDITWNGGGGCFDVDRGSQWGSLTLAANQSLGIQNSGYLIFEETGAVALALGDNATLTMSGSGTVQYRRRDDGPLYSLGSACTVNGPSSFYLRSIATGTDITLPAWTYTGSGSVYILPTDSGVETITLAGAFNIGSNYLYIADGNLAGSYSFDADQYSITCGILVIGKQNPSSTMSWYLGSGSHTATEYRGTTYDAAGTGTVYLETSTLAVSGDINLGINKTYDRGTSQVIAGGTSSCSWTSNGKTLYDVVINKTANGVTLTDALSVGGDLTLTDGTFDQAGKNVTVVGDVAINTNDAATIDGYWSVGGDFTLGASSSATVTGSRVKLSKANAVVALNNKTMPACSSAAGVYFEDGGTIARLVMQNPRDTIKLEALKKFTFTALDSADINGKADSLTYWLSSSAGSRDTLDFPSTMYFSYTAWKDQISSDTVYVNDGTSDNLGGNLWP